MLFRAGRLLGRIPRPLLVALGVALLGLGVWEGARHVRGWRHYAAALGALDRRDFPAALEELDACLEEWPSSASVRFLAARTARRANQPERAEAHLDECQRLGGSAEGLVLEGYLLRAQRGDQAAVEKKLLAFVHRDHPDTPYVLEVLTARWMADHRLKEALHYLELWQRRDPADREAVARRAWVLEQLRHFHSAIDGYRAALDMGPDQDRQENDRLRLRLGELLLLTSRPREAAPHFEEMHERQPSNPAVLLGLARCRRLAGRTEEAARLLDTLLAAEPRHAEALAERGHVALAAAELPHGDLERPHRLAERGLAFDEGNVKAAEAWLRKALAARPHDRAALYALSQCLRNQGRHDEARKHQQEADRVRADEQRMGELMRQALDSPEDADVRCEVGRVFLRNSMAEDGVRWLRSALVHDPWHPGAHRALAEHYESLGQPDRAAPHRKALGATP
jgi:tetratricopeptide (TPR) repeat protein